LRCQWWRLMMASMFASGSTWLCLVVGVVVLAEAAVLFVLRVGSGTGAERRGPRGQLPMLVSLGVALISGSVARLVGLSGAGLTVAFLIGAIGAVGALVFAIRSLGALRRGASPSQK
jgi:hypothetical protein